jgi:hypothetical protein
MKMPGKSRHVQQQSFNGAKSPLALKGAKSGLSRQEACAMLFWSCFWFSQAHYAAMHNGAGKNRNL